MRGTRAKKLHKQALANPSHVRTGFVGRTYVNGGVRRAYKDLKKKWAMRGWA